MANAAGRMPQMPPARKRRLARPHMKVRMIREGWCPLAVQIARMIPVAATAAPAMSTHRSQPKASPVSNPAPRNGSSARRLAICSLSSIEPQFDKVEPMLNNMMRLLTPTKMHANVTFCGRISAGEVIPLSHHVAPTVAPSGLSLADGQFVGIGFAVDEDRVTVADVTGEQRPCQAVTDRLLDEPAQRAGAVCRVCLLY